MSGFNPDVTERLKQYGFEPSQTGGGCTAYCTNWQKYQNAMITITAYEDCYAPQSLDEPIWVGFTHMDKSSSEDMLMLKFANIPEFLDHIS